MIADMYVFELKETKELYAYTKNKKIAKRFLKERNKECFHYYKLDLDNLSKKDQEKLVMKISFDGSYEIKRRGILFDGKNNIPLLLTEKEIYEMCDVIDEIISEITYTYDMLVSESSEYFKLNKKEWKTISILTDFIKNDDIDENYFRNEEDNEIKFYKNINSFRLFYDLFGFTMDKNIHAEK